MIFRRILVMGMPTMLASSVLGMMTGAIEVNKEAYANGKKTLEQIEEELKNGAFSKNNISRILKEIKGEKTEDDFNINEIIDCYKIKSNSSKLIVKSNKQKFCVQDVIKHNNINWVIQQINDFGDEVEFLIKY
jgi:hypothetical protein